MRKKTPFNYLNAKGLFPKSPTVKVRDKAVGNLERMFIAPDNEFDILVLHPLSGFKKDRFDKQVKGKGKFRRVKLW
jgi:hypothetical protein